MSTEDRTFSLNEREQALDSLAQSLSSLAKVEQNPLQWKWFIIAFHNAIHSFMLIALNNGDDSGIWENEQPIRINGGIDVLNPRNKLVNFLQAFQWIQESSRMGGTNNTKCFQSSNIEDIRNKMEALNDGLRNQFIHFRPIFWGASPDYLSGVCLPLLEIIEFLIFQSDRVRLFELQSSTVKAYISAIKALLELHSKDRGFGY